ncbi:MAG: 2-polyprenyl-3-methyl-6-methoxy-1,4-benzoquinone monooxygenase [Mariprofundaceae bacterium]|nr:2-polyprenyl-3-methyl-6-methoxy-1,4-benzoquinone monooxygenase [Mariprofundaceae bacterium]
MANVQQKDGFRHFNGVDGVIDHLDRALNSVFCSQSSTRVYPAEDMPDDNLDHAEKKHVAALMRVNHAGEIAAQALYHGQSITARDASLKDELHHASLEESEHLNWCRRRLQELDAKPSALDPLWYAGSFAIGVAAGVVGDRWNLGFLAETEHQVVRHLESHLEQLPAQDARSRAIVGQMKQDEQAHAELAESLGAADLPKVVQGLMKLSSQVMTTLAHKV